MLFDAGHALPENAKEPASGGSHTLGRLHPTVAQLGVASGPDRQTQPPDAKSLCISRDVDSFCPGSTKPKLQDLRRRRNDSDSHNISQIIRGPNLSNFINHSSITSENQISRNDVAFFQSTQNFGDGGDGGVSRPFPVNDFCCIAGLLRKARAFFSRIGLQIRTGSLATHACSRARRSFRRHGGLLRGRFRGAFGSRLGTFRHNLSPVFGLQLGRQRRTILSIIKGHTASLCLAHLCLRSVGGVAVCSSFQLVCQFGCALFVTPICCLKHLEKRLRQTCWLARLKASSLPFLFWRLLGNSRLFATSNGHSGPEVKQ